MEQYQICLPEQHKIKFLKHLDRYQNNLSLTLNNHTTYMVSHEGNMGNKLCIRDKWGSGQSKDLCVS